MSKNIGLKKLELDLAINLQSIFTPKKLETAIIGGSTSYSFNFPVIANLNRLIIALDSNNFFSFLDSLKGVVQGCTNLSMIYLTTFSQL